MAVTYFQQTPSPPTHLKKRVSTSSTQSQSPAVFKLPLEILLLVLELLSKEAVICFSLACKALYRQFFPKAASRQDLDRVARKALLVLLEKDIDHSFFCYDCLKLHPWRLDGRILPWDVRGRSPSYRGCRAMHPFKAPLPEGHSLQYNLARLVMNHHLYGPSHGFPLVMIEGTFRKRCPTNDVRYQQCWRARIIQDELFLCTIFTYYHPENTTDSLMRFMRVSHQQVCPHLRIRASNASTVASWPRNLPELNEDLAIPNRFITPVRDGISSCAICRTDYQVKIQHRPSWKMWGPRGWIISIVTWQQLGKCRSPFDWDWRIMALDVMNDLNSRWRSHADMPGVIRHRWSLGDDILLEPEGNFVSRARTL